MTLYVPLDSNVEFPNSPPFLQPSKTPQLHLENVVQAILKAKRIAVVCGAGISVGAGIPDFRSQDGLFQSLKRDHPKESLTSGKDLFDASVFKSTQKTALFYRMIADLASLSAQGQPTAFHKLLRTLDDRGQLLRVYTQNIDALEMKAGLSFGVPEFEEKHMRVKLKGKAKVKAKEAGNSAYNSKQSWKRKKNAAQTIQNSILPPLTGEEQPVAGPSTLPVQATPTGSNKNDSKRPPLCIIPRCIPLHGTLLTLHCQHCTQSFPLEPPPLPSDRGFSPPPSPVSHKPPSLHSLLALGTPPPCPSCTALEQTRALVGKRLRGIGKLRPSVVLYGEDHREGEGVGEAVRRDLCGIGEIKFVAPPPESGETSTPTKTRAPRGKGPDLLLVVGTSLRVPGTKRIVREFSKAVRSGASPAPSRLPTPSPPPQVECPTENIKTIYLNNEFPLPCREWEGIFDVWVDGDVQNVARFTDAMVLDDERRLAEKKQKAAAKEAVSALTDDGAEAKSASTPIAKGKRKAGDYEGPITPNKRKKVELYIPRTPVSLAKPFQKHQENSQDPANNDDSSVPNTPKCRRVILRLPPPPLSPSPCPPSRKRSVIPPAALSEVVISKTPLMPPFATLSPLTSLSTSSTRSSLSPPPSPSGSNCSSPSPACDEICWCNDSYRDDVRRRAEQHRFMGDMSSLAVKENATLSSRSSQHHSASNSVHANPNDQNWSSIYDYVDTPGQLEGVQARTFSNSTAAVVGVASQSWFTPSSS